jgi:transcriptional regulator with XRE-family HTH domain
MRSADLICEARLRAGLSQYELADLTGRDRTVIARWEHGHVSPSLETLLELLHACGFDLPTELVPYDAPNPKLQKNALLSPERRIHRLLRRHTSNERHVSAPGRFDPYAIVTALERHRVGYVLIGAFARVLQRTE